MAPRYFPSLSFFKTFEYIFHNIKIHGKHLKNDPNIKNYNNVVKELPHPEISRIGQSITYIRDKKRDFLTFQYYVCINKKKYKYINIIEIMPIPKNGQSLDAVKTQQYRNVFFP